MKSGKAKQNGKKELRRARNTQNQHGISKEQKSSKSTQKLKRARKTQNQNRSSKEQERLKINTPPEINSP
jgi:hypothetical protein